MSKLLKTNLLILSVAAIILVGSFSDSLVSKVRAYITSTNLTGYAWSDNIGWISFSSENVLPPVGGSYAPNSPAITSTPASSKQVTVKWNTPHDNGSPITNYKLYRSAVSGFIPDESNGIATTNNFTNSYIDSGLTDNTIYYYKVSAVNSVGEGSTSGQVAGYPGASRVFITSETYNGNLGGLSGADTKCSNLATAAGLTGTYKAWLSTNDISAYSRMVRSTKPYINMNGALIAEDWTHIASPSTGAGYLPNYIIWTEAGAGPISGAWVFTNTDKDGARFVTDYSGLSPAADCSGWTLGTVSSKGGIVGLSDDSRYQSFWTAVSTDDCTGPARLYCFEQPVPCTYVYSAYTPAVCSTGVTQTRTVISTNPAGCTPDTAPVLGHRCPGPGLGI